MNKIFILLSCTLCTLLTMSCNQIDAEKEIKDEGDCLVSFNLVGEILTTQDPMTKVSTEDIYFIQVYRGNNPFASGVFDDLSYVKFFLKKGTEKYRIIVSLIKNGKSALGDDYRASDNSIHAYSYAYFDYAYSYTNPTPKSIIGRSDRNLLNWLQSFVKTSNSDYLGVSEYEKWIPLNSIYYNVFDYPSNSVWYRQTSYTYKNKGYANNLLIQLIDINTTLISGVKYPSCDDWLYGEINNYSPNGNYETLSLDLKRVGFKIKYELSGVSDGEVSVSVYKVIDPDNYTTRYFIENTTSGTSYSSDPVFYAFYDAHSAWEYADDYMENMLLSVAWHREIGITENYGSKTIQIKRNCLNNIKIQMTSADQSSAGMNLTVEAESTIGAEGVTIPVQ